MKGLIFGANGQDGYYLAAELRRRGIEAIGVSRSGDWIHADVSRFDDVEAIVREHRPDYLFQLAANSTTKHAALFDNHAAIATGALNVLESAWRHCPECRVFLPGSGVQFRNTGAPISEEDPFDPASPYAIARIQSVYAGRYYRGLGLRAYVGYLFHHESPRRQPNHISKIVASAARRIAAGSAETLELGDLDVTKEWTFAGDVATAILALVEQETLFEANLGSGEPHSIQEWVARCFQAVDLDWKAHVRTQTGFVAEYPRLVSNPQKIRDLGWEPKVGFGELAELMMSEP